MMGSMKTFAQAIRDRRSTPSFDGKPMPASDLRQILDAGLHSPSGYNLQPWRFIVVQNAEGLRRLRGACYNQAKVEEASVVIVCCGDRDGWRKDMQEMLRLGREAGMPEAYAAQAETHVTSYLSGFSAEQMNAWLNKQVTIAATSMLWMAEVLGYDTAPMEGFEAEKVCEALKLPMSYTVVSMLAVGHLKGADKFDGGRFGLSHTVFGEEYGKALK